MGIFILVLLKNPRIPSIRIRQTQPSPPRPVVLVGSAGLDGFRFATSKAEVGAATACSSNSSGSNKGSQALLLVGGTRTARLSQCLSVWAQPPEHH